MKALILILIYLFGIPLAIFACYCLVLAAANRKGLGLFLSLFGLGAAVWLFLDLTGIHHPLVLVATGAGYLLGAGLIGFILYRWLRKPVPPHVVIRDWKGPENEEEARKIQKKWEEFSEEITNDYVMGIIGYNSSSRFDRN